MVFMLCFVFIIAVILNSYFCFRSRLNKFTVVFTSVSILLIWVWNNSGPDISNYVAQYSVIDQADFSTNGYQIIYNIVMYLFAKSGFSFYTYRLILSLVSLVALFFTLKVINPNVHVVILMYLLTQFFLDGIQIRNFFALPFLYVAIVIYLKKPRKWKIWYVIFVLLASLVHISFIVYLVFLLVPDSPKMDSISIRLHFIISFVICFVLMIGRRYVPLLVSLISSVDAHRANSYSVNQTNFGPFISIGLQLLSVFCIRYCYLRMNRTQNGCEIMSTDEYTIDIETVKRIYWLNIIGLYLVPFSFVQLTFYRLIRNILLINFSAFGITNKYYRRSTNLFLVGFIYVVVWIIVEFVILNNYQTIIEPFFINSDLFH